jgi:glucosamine-6-phosphate deaminase
MRERFFERVNIKRHNAHLPDGMAEDLEAECAHYEQLIKESGGIDLQLLGIGLNGHLGFNEPPAAFQSRTRVENLSSVTRAQNAPLFPDSRPVPRRAITMGVGTILQARQCLLLATGSEKAEVVAKAIEGPLSTAITASVLQNHPACTVVLDQAAAGGLRKVNHCQQLPPGPAARLGTPDKAAHSSKGHADRRVPKSFDSFKVLPHD